MIQVVERLALDFRTFAPELIASPKQSLFRVYRDTRFSDNKKPLKTHAAAIFRTRELPKPQGAGLYFEIAPGWVWIGGGMWRPEPPELVRIREHIADTWPEMRGIAGSAAFRRRFEELSGDTMTRVPRGYRADHPAAAYLKYRQFYGGAEFPAVAGPQPRVLSDAAGDVQGADAARPVPQRAAYRGPGGRCVTKYRPMS